MERTDILYLATLPIVVAALIGTSCIFDGCNDEFDKTLWMSDEVPLGPFEIDKLTLEFLGDKSISLKTEVDTIFAYGTYDSNEHVAIFSGLTVDIEGRLITFVDAQLSGETLFLRWRIENSIYPFTTAMHQKVKK